MPADAPRVRVMLTGAQQRARVRSLAYGAVVSVVLAIVLVVVAAGADRAARWLALFVAVFPLAVALFATRAAIVLRRLRPPAAAATTRRAGQRGTGKLPVNLAKAADTAVSEGTAEARTAPTEPV